MGTRRWAASWAAPGASRPSPPASSSSSGSPSSPSPPWRPTRSSTQGSKVEAVHKGQNQGSTNTECNKKKKNNNSISKTKTHRRHNQEKTRASFEYHHITLRKRHPMDVAMASEGPPITTKSKSTPLLPAPLHQHGRGS